MQHIEERYYHRLPAGGSNQGDIWTGLPGGPHSATQVTGIIITPRCDLAHEKTRLLNYIPLISIDELMLSSGGFALLEQEEANIRQALRNLAMQLGVAELYDVGADVADLRAVVQTAIDTAPSDKHRERIETTYSKFAQQLLRRSSIQEVLAKPVAAQSELDALVPESAIQGYKRDVIRNSKPDIFFLPPCFDLLPSPSVALLRSVVACSYDLVQSALSSLTPSDWQRTRRQHASPEFLAATTPPERILRLKTPFVEALMARFCALFGRVGTRDLTTEEVAAFMSWRP